MIIEVTAEDIAQGIKTSAYSCPLARSLNRALFGRPEAPDLGPYVSVNSECVRVWENAEVATGSRRFRLSSVQEVLPTQEMIKFMVAFDHGKKVEPRTFRIALKGKKNA